MNWEKAKTLTIVFLLLINVFLAILVYYSGHKYTMTAVHDTAIRQYMSRNGVSLNASIPRNFKPMAVLRMKPSQYDDTALAHAVFGSIDDVGSSVSDGQPVYDRGSEELRVGGDSFTYINTLPSDGYILTYDDAVNICEEFLSKHEKILGRYVFDRIRETRDGYSVIFCGKFRDRLIGSNTLVFNVTAGGISRISGVYNAPVDIKGEAREIISPNEAMYLFVEEKNFIFDEDEVIVDGVDLVYYLAERATDSSILTSATPYYRILFFVGEDSDEAQIMINAYTGGMLSIRKVF